MLTVKHMLQVKNGDYVGVTLSGVSKPTTYDAVAIYIQDPSDSAVGLNKLLKYKWANADLSYVSTGNTTFRCGLHLPQYVDWALCADQRPSSSRCDCRFMVTLCASPTHFCLHHLKHAEKPCSSLCCQECTHAWMSPAPSHRQMLTLHAPAASGSSTSAGRWWSTSSPMPHRPMASSAQRRWPPRLRRCPSATTTSPRKCTWRSRRRQGATCRQPGLTLAQPSSHAVTLMLHRGTAACLWCLGKCRVLLLYAGVHESGMVVPHDEGSLATE